MRNEGWLRELVSSAGESSAYRPQEFDRDAERRL